MLSGPIGMGKTYLLDRIGLELLQLSDCKIRNRIGFEVFMSAAKMGSKSSPFHVWKSIIFSMLQDNNTSKPISAVQNIRNLKSYNTDDRNNMYVDSNGKRFVYNINMTIIKQLPTKIQALKSLLNESIFDSDIFKESMEMSSYSGSLKISLTIKLLFSIIKQYIKQSTMNTVILM